jgi:prepilin-type N-terminal cleavage/methylation domain-containing protein
MKTKNFKHPAERKSEKGLSVIELLIAMAVFLIVMGSVYGILKIGNASRTTINSRSENIKNVRMAINSIGREAVNAGLGYNRIGGNVPDDFTNDNFMLPADKDRDPDLLTAISAGFNISESDLSKNGEKNDVVAFAFRDFQFNDGFPIIINNVEEDGNQLILKTPEGICVKCRPFDLFLIETGDGKQAVILSTDVVNNNSIVLGGEKDPLHINYGKGKGKESSTVKKCKPSIKTECIDYGSTTVIAKKIYLVSYSVTADGTLIRTTYGNNTGAGADEQIFRQPIANGVRSFKIQYLLSDGTVTTDPSVANTQKEKCNDIVQIEVTATVDPDSSIMGKVTSDAIVLTSTFSTRNLKYDVY